MTHSPEGQQPPGAPDAPDPSQPPVASPARSTVPPPDALARLLDRRSSVDGAHAGALLRALVDAAPLAMWVLDPDGCVVLWNAAAQRLTGWSPEETLGRPVPIIPADKREEFRALFARLLRKETVVDAEVRRQRKDGSPIDLSLSSAPIEAPDGAVAAVLVMATDLTARKEAEEAARQLASARAVEESEARLRSLVEATSQVVWTTDAEGRTVKPLAERTALTGQPAPDAQGYGMWRTVHPDDRADVERLWMDAVASRRPFSATFRLRVAEGSYRWFAARGVPVLNADGTVREWVGTSSDIHERKSAEAALRQSEARFRNLADSAPVMLWVTEPDGSCSFLSRGWYEFTGQTAERGLGTSWLDAVHADDREAAGRIFHSSTASREPFEFEYRLRRADGEYRWVTDTARPRYGAEGEFAGHVGSIIDITERRRAEDALRESERRHRRIFDTVEVSIWEEDFSAVREAIEGLRAEGVTDIRRYLAGHPEFIARMSALVRVRDVNDASLAMFGAPDKAALMASLPRVFVPETAGTFAEQLAAIFEGRTRLQSEAPLQTLDGRRLDVAFTVAFPPDDPQLRSVLVSLLDITDRKRVEGERERLLGAERAARRRIEQLQAVTAALVEAVTVEDVADRVLEAVRATTTSRSATLALLTADGTEFEAVRIAGLPPEEAARWRRFPADPAFPSTQALRTGEPVFLRSSDEIRERFPAIADDALAYGFAASAVLPLIVAGTTVGTLGLNYGSPQPFDAEKRAYLAAVAQQCAQALERARLFEAERSARAEAETSRRDADAARAAAERASRAKSDFLATMSHELRTPLNAIIGYQSLLVDGVTGPVSDAQRRQLERLGSSAHHLLMLIDEVLTLSRVEAGKESMNVERVDVARILDEAATIVEPLARQKNLDFQVVGPDTPTAIETDAGKVRQAIVNLLSNAVKFTGRGGVTLRARSDGDAVVFEVHDTGIGIAADHVERIFEPFWQVEGSMTRTVPGTGLGLAVTRRLATLLGGEVGVRSVVGEGSTFTLRVPIRSS